MFDLFDIERMEVLRGPQGTLFGRNNVGGAIVVRTNRPTDQFEGSVKLTVGADDRAEALATVNLPITGDLRSRITMLSAQQDGFVNNLDGGDDLGDKDRFAARAVIEWAPSEDMIVTFAADTTRARDSAVPSVLLGLAPTIPGTPFPSDLQAISNLNGACGGGSVLGNSGNPACVDQQYIVGPFDGYGGFVSPHPIFDSQGSHAYQNESKMDLWGASLTFEWDIQSNLTFKSVSAWRDIDSFWPSNSDHSPNPGAEAKNDFDQQQFSQEIQFLGTALDDNLDWVIGAYYLKEEGENLNVVHFPGVIFRS